MKFKVKTIETNEARVKKTGLKEAPLLEGYFYRREECVENLSNNILRGREGKPPRFKQLFLETKNACNLSCPM
jgi:hypothetical protein